MRTMSFIVVWLFFYGVVAGELKKWPEWDDAVRIDFARCLYSEDSSGTDWPAIGWALVKQWRLKRRRMPEHTFHRQVRWYCAVFERNGPQWLGERPGRILSSTWDNPPYKRDLAAWQALRKFIRKFERQNVVDPCPSCVWWGGPKCDTIPANWTCPLGPPETKNVFCHLIGTPGR